MKPVVFSILLGVTMVTSVAALVTSSIALSQSNQAITTSNANSLYARNDEVAMTWLAGKTAVSAFRLGQQIAIPTSVSKLWAYATQRTKQ